MIRRPWTAKESFWRIGEKGLIAASFGRYPSYLFGIVQMPMIRIVGLKRSMIAVLWGGAALFLAGCASLSEDACLEGDWQGIGMRDGAAGHVAESRFGAHLRACNRVGVVPDRQAWQLGYARGLQSYCTPSSGLSEGQAGRPYRNVCPVATKAGFLSGHELGQAEHDRRSRMRDLNREIDHRTHRIAALRKALQESDADTALHEELRQNEAEISRLRLDLGLVRLELAAIEREVRAFRAGL